MLYFSAIGQIFGDDGPLAGLLVGRDGEVQLQFAVDGGMVAAVFSRLAIGIENREFQRNDGF
ncbi:MAG: hypothetical protein J6T06_04620 [Victivallales bacterium]|nr:hypothetical protein [Victivallales bacterium]